jgi:hypothetical protein
MLLKNNWDYGFRYLSTGFTGAAYVEFLNKWNITNTICFTSKALDTRLLRGGTSMYVPANWQESVTLKTDDSKNIAFCFDYSRTLPNKQLSSSSYSSTITTQPCNLLKLSLNLNYASNKDDLQYVATMLNNGKEEPILARINQQTLSATFRADFSITPELSLQYYGSPYSATGRYSSFKRVADPLNKSYDNRFALLDKVGYSDNVYYFDGNGDGKNDYIISNPDFNYSQFRSNFVLRWEYRPGSQLYFVWSNEITGYQNPGTDRVTSIFRGLSKGVACNIFLVKLSYWFSL